MNEQYLTSVFPACNKSCALKTLSLATDSTETKPTLYMFDNPDGISLNLLSVSFPASTNDQIL